MSIQYRKEQIACLNVIFHQWTTDIQLCSGEMEADKEKRNAYAGHIRGITQGRVVSKKVL